MSTANAKAQQKMRPLDDLVITPKPKLLIVAYKN
jgi:hypothetical protein